MCTNIRSKSPEEIIRDGEQTVAVFGHGCMHICKHGRTYMCRHGCMNITYMCKKMGARIYVDMSARVYLCMYAC